MRAGLARGSVATPMTEPVGAGRAAKADGRTIEARSDVDDSAEDVLGCSGVTTLFCADQA